MSYENGMGLLWLKNTQNKARLWQHHLVRKANNQRLGG